MKTNRFIFLQRKLTSFESMDESVFRAHSFSQSAKGNLFLAIGAARESSALLAPFPQPSKLRLSTEWLLRIAPLFRLAPKQPSQREKEIFLLGGRARAEEFFIRSTMFALHHCVETALKSALICASGMSDNFFVDSRNGIASKSVMKNHNLVDLLTALLGVRPKAVKTDIEFLKFLSEFAFSGRYFLDNSWHLYSNELPPALHWVKDAQAGIIQGDGQTFEAVIGMAFLVLENILENLRQICASAGLYAYSDDESAQKKLDEDSFFYKKLASLNPDRWPLSALFEHQKIFLQKRGQYNRSNFKNPFAPIADDFFHLHTMVRMHRGKPHSVISRMT